MNKLWTIELNNRFSFKDSQTSRGFHSRTAMRTHNHSSIASFVFNASRIPMLFMLAFRCLTAIPPVESGRSTNSNFRGENNDAAHSPRHHRRRSSRGRRSNEDLFSAAAIFYARWLWRRAGETKPRGSGASHAIAPLATQRTR